MKNNKISSESRIIMNILQKISESNMEDTIEMQQRTQNTINTRGCGGNTQSSVDESGWSKTPVVDIINKKLS